MRWLSISLRKPSVSVSLVCNVYSLESWPVMQASFSVGNDKKAGKYDDNKLAIFGSLAGFHGNGVGGVQQQRR